MGNSKKENVAQEIKEGNEKLTKEIQEVLGETQKNGTEVTKLNQEIQMLKTEMKELKNLILKLTETKLMEEEEEKNKIKEEPKKEEKKKLTPVSEKDKPMVSVPPEIFEEMITNSGFSVSDFCKFGMNVLLIFTNTLGLLFKIFFFSDLLNNN